MAPTPQVISSYLQKKKLPPKPTGVPTTPEVQPPGYVSMQPVGNPVPLFNPQGQTKPTLVPKPTGISNPTISQGQPKPGLVPKPTGIPTPVVPAVQPQTSVHQTPDRFRFDAQYAPQYRALDTQQVNMAADVQGMMGRLNNDYASGQAGLRRENESMLEALKNRMADQGILRSGIYAGEQGEQGENYLSALNQLSGDRASGLADLETQFSRGQADLNSQRENLLFNQGRDELHGRLQEDQRRAEAEGQRNLLNYIQGQMNPGRNQRDDVVNMFKAYGVPMTYGARPGESAQDRLNRIANELAGGRTKENLMASLARLMNQRRGASGNARPY